MAKRGRPSAADLAVVPTTPERQSIQPPKQITPRARQIFAELVAATAPEHFAPSDVPVLTTFCEAVALREQAQQALADQGVVVDGDTNPWFAVLNKQDKTIATLGMRLRLVPSARYDAKKAARNAGRTPSAYQTKPWEAS